MVLNGSVLTQKKYGRGLLSAMAGKEEEYVSNGISFL